MSKERPRATKLPLETMGTIVGKIRIGDSLFNAELDAAIEFYTAMEEGLRVLGPAHHLGWRDVASTLERLRSFKEARSNRG